MKINTHYLDLEESYLFSEIAHRVARYTEEHPEADVIRMGIGDVTLPLCEAAVQALHSAADESVQKRELSWLWTGAGLRFPARRRMPLLCKNGRHRGRGRHLHR